MSWRRFSTLALVIAVTSGMTGLLAGADDEAKQGAAAKKAAAKDDEAKEEKDDADAKEDEDKDRYKLPDDADVEALEKFVEELRGVRPATREEAIEKWLPTLKKASLKIMDLKKDDKKSQSYRDAQQLYMQLRMNDLVIGEAAEQKKVIGEIKQFLTDKAESKDLTFDDARLAQVAAQRLEFSGKTDLAKEAIEGFQKPLATAGKEDEQIQSVADALAGTLRRMNLVGNKIEISGKTVDGKDFDWAAYSKDKVILIDFWATWCGPCIAELPNVKKNYDKYHDKGFDVVGISLDEDREKLESFLEKEKTPWIQLFEEGKGWQHPVAKHYGIQGIPTVILVDKEGKVVSLNARGPELGKLLEKHLGGEDAKSEGKPDKNEEETKGDAKPAKKPA